MDLHYSDETGVQVVCLGLFGVENLHWEGSPRDGEDGSFEEILWELDGIERRWGHDQLQVFAFLYRLKRDREGHFMWNGILGTELGLLWDVKYLLEEAKEHIGVDCSLMSLIQHDEGVLAHVRVDQTLPLQHSMSHVLDHRLCAGAVLKADGVAHLKLRLKHCHNVSQKLQLVWNV